MFSPCLVSPLEESQTYANLIYEMCKILPFRLQGFKEFMRLNDSYLNLYFWEMCCNYCRLLCISMGWNTLLLWRWVLYLL